MKNKMQTMFKEYVYDFSVDGGATGSLTLRSADPNSATLEEGDIIKDVIVLNELALTSGGTPTIKFGTGADDDGFFVDSYALITSLASIIRAGELDGALIWDTTADAKRAYRVGSGSTTKTVKMAIGTAALTAGKLRVILEIYKPGTEIGAV